MNTLLYKHLRIATLQAFRRHKTPVFYVPDHTGKPTPEGECATMTNSPSFSPSTTSTPARSSPLASKNVRRFAADACAGAGFFVLIATMAAGTGSIAATFSLAETSEASTALALAQSSGNEHSILVLGLVFSVLFAFNAAFFRHLGRAYTGAGRRTE
jgi:hypothetical protein